MSDGTLAVGLQKVPTGIQGFDEITGGGLPQERVTLVVGAPGTGKTVFALQTLVHGALRANEPGIFVAFEESARQIKTNASTFGWDLPSLSNDRLFFLDAHLSPLTIKSGEFDLAALLAAVEARSRQMGARRIVFDSIDVLLTLLDDPIAERRELYRLHEWMMNSGLTSILTAKAIGPDPMNLPRYPFLPFLVDCVLVLSQQLAQRVALREMRVVKYRGSGFAENAFPLSIGPHGMQVAGPGAPEQDFPAFTERVSTGVARLDHMLGGGYYLGSSVLISGSPGTAKSTLAGAFAEASCKRGERVLLLSFDEVAAEVVRNLASVGIRLAPHVEEGRLLIHSARTEVKSAEEHMMTLRGLLDQHRPRALVIDPISALVKAGGHLTAVSVAQRMLRLTKASGITLICTSLLESEDAEVEASEIDISAMADTWIHLSYVILGGERNRALTVVKSRGTHHSNQVRELILSDEGVTLADVYVAGGEVLMGTARWEKEMAEQMKQEQTRRTLEQKQREVALAEAEVRARVEALQRELEVRHAELAELTREQDIQAGRQTRRHEELLRLRHADAQAPEGTEENGA